jgi:hypothetical protein
MAGENETGNDSFSAFPHMIYPVYYIFREIATVINALVIPCQTDFPLQMSSLLLKTTNQF